MSNFTPALAEPISDAIGLDLADDGQPIASGRRGRRQGFVEEVLSAYAYQCAMCGYDGALLRNPAGLQAAHVQWHSQGGPDNLRNGIALCAIHHVLLDLGILGLTRELTILVSPLYVARTTVGKAVDALAGRPLSEPRPGLVPLDLQHVDAMKSRSTCSMLMR